MQVRDQKGRPFGIWVLKLGRVRVLLKPSSFLFMSVTAKKTYELPTIFFNYCKGWGFRWNPRPFDWDKLKIQTVTRLVPQNMRSVDLLPPKMSQETQFCLLWTWLCGGESLTKTIVLWNWIKQYFFTQWRTRKVKGTSFAYSGARLCGGQGFTKNHCPILQKKSNYYIMWKNRATKRISIAYSGLNRAGVKGLSSNTEP